MSYRKFSLLMLLALLLVCAAPIAAQNEIECEEGFRLIVHDLGETCIPENPQRIVTDNLDTIGLMMTLGIEPVAHNHESVNGLVSTAPELEAVGAEFNANSLDVGFPMSLEVVLTANPDLILVENTETLEQLEAIAPVIAYDVYANIAESREMNWYDPMMFWADVLGATEEAEVQRDLVEQRLDILTEYTQGTTVSIIHMNTFGESLLAGSPMWVYEQLARRANLARPEIQSLTLDEHEERYGTTFWGSYSLEEIDTADGDVLIMTTSRGDAETEAAVEAFTAQIEANPLWGTLNVVQQDAFYQVNYSQWISFDFASVNRTIDDMFRFIAGVDPAEISPNPFLADDMSETMEASEEASATFQVPGFDPFAPAPPFVEVIEDRGDTLVVRHFFGETEIPADPERIYADASTLDILLSLGIEPIAANSLYGPDYAVPPAPDLIPLLENVTLYERGPANLEVILSLEPDLIMVNDIVLTWSDDPEALYESLSAIAPTVITAGDTQAYWQEATVAIAEVFGESDLAAQLLEDFEAIKEEQCGRIRDALGEDATLTLIEVYPGSTWLIGTGYQDMGAHIPNHPTTWAYRECGILPGNEILSLIGPSGGNIQLSSEILPQLQADHLVVLVVNADEDMEALAETAIWQALPAVQQGNVYFSNYSTNFGYYGASYALEFYADVLSGEEVSE
ncbi:MAG: ABC transporter substrate-binding protein [Chloroflexota bacterium]